MSVCVCVRERQVELYNNLCTTGCQEVLSLVREREREREREGVCVCLCLRVFFKMIEVRVCVCVRGCVWWCGYEYVGEDVCAQCALDSLSVCVWVGWRESILCVRVCMCV